jgi:hypothetical protein
MNTAEKLDYCDKEGEISFFSLTDDEQKAILAGIEEVKRGEFDKTTTWDELYEELDREIKASELQYNKD